MCGSAVNALAETFVRDLDPATGFLPRRTPARTLPPRWSRWQEAAMALPSRYHAPSADARAWLGASFAAPVPDADTAIGALSEPEVDRLNTVVSVLAHAARWSSAPPTVDAYQLTALTLPPGLADPWRALCRRQDHPRVGNLYSMVLANWDLEGVEGGQTYDVERLTGEAIRPAILWLRPPKDEALRSFLRTPIETEARGAAVIRTAVDLVRTSARRDTHAATGLFERLHGELAEMARPFRDNIRKQLFTADDFLTLIQPTTLWGLDEGEGPVEGASGPQVGVLQVVDALLGTGSGSPMGRAVQHTRRYLPARHRRFLEAFDAAAPVVREWVQAARDRALTALFNACLSSMKAWRLVHQKRGAMYLKSDTPGLVQAYTSTGGVVSLEDERIRRFEAAMQERVGETTVAVLPSPVEDPLPERPFRYLTPDDLDVLRAAAWVHSYRAGEEILKAGVRRTGLFLLREGDAEVRAIGDATLARLVPGTIFGELSYLENDATSASVVAATDCRVEIIPRDHIYALCETRDGFAERWYLSIARIVAARLRETSSKLAAAESELRARRPGRIQVPPSEH